jgi:hypothetical protein
MNSTTNQVFGGPRMGEKTITNQLWRRLRRRPSVKPMENQLPLWHQCYLRNVRG